MPKLKDWLKKKGKQLKQKGTQVVYEMQRGNKTVSGKVGDVGSALNLAKDAVQHVRSALPIRESNRETNVKRTGGWSDEVVDRLRDELDALADYVIQGMDTELQQLIDGGMDPDVLNQAVNLAFVAGSAARYAAGNCGEQSATAILHLLRDVKCTVPVEWFHMEGGDHAFAVLNRPSDSTAGDYKTWGNGAVVCDPWYNRAFLAKDFLLNLPLRMGTPAVDIRIEPGSDEATLVVWVYEAYLDDSREVAKLWSLPQDPTEAERVKQKIKDDFDSVVEQIKLGNLPKLKKTQRLVIRRFIDDTMQALRPALKGPEAQKYPTFFETTYRLLLAIEIALTTAATTRAVERFRGHVREGAKSIKTLAPLLRSIEEVQLAKMVRTLDLQLGRTTSGVKA